MGQCTDHVPLPTLSQEADSSTFSFILPTLSCALILCFHLPSLFSLFQAPTMKCHLPPSYATCSSTHPTHHHITLTTTTATPSEHATKHAQLPLPLPSLSHALFYPLSLPLHFHLCLTAPLLCCQCHQYPPHHCCLAIQTKDTKPLKN
jgi:hypothetical protein